MEATVLRRRDEVEALAPAWAELLADSPSDGPTLSPDWLLSWWDVYGAGRRLCFVRFDAGGRLVGLAPLSSRRHWYKPGIPFRRLEPLGSGEAEADSVCSDYLDVIARRGHEEAVARAFVAALTGGAMGGWDEFVVPLMAGDGPMPSLLLAACRGAGLRAEAPATTEAPHVPLPASWDAYLGLLGRKERYLVKRTLRDFEAWAGGEAEFRLAATPEDVEQGKRVLRELHHERWQGTGGGTFRSRPFLDFHDRVMARFLLRGALDLRWLTVRSQPVAAMYSFRWGRKVHFYQCGRRLDVPKDVRPGGVLLYHAIRSAIEAGLGEFDFLGGAAVYKSQLALASRPLLGLRVTRPSVVEALRRGAEWGKEKARPWLRRPAPERPREVEDSVPAGTHPPAKIEKQEKSLTTGGA